MTANGLHGEAGVAPGEFTAALLSSVLANAYHHYPDNIDFDRFGRPPLRSRLRGRAVSAIRHGLQIATGGNRVLPDWSGHDQIALAALTPQLGALEELYASLSDHASRDLLIKLIAFRILGSQRVKLPLAADHTYERELHRIEGLASGEEAIEVAFPGQARHLRCFDLAPIGFPIRLFSLAGGVANTFTLKQYEHADSVRPIKVERGDVVIDAGGCWGDTTLHFAHESGARVLVFEFIPSNLAVLERNIGLNPALRGIVDVVAHPLWSRSGVPVYCQDNGPSSRVSFERPSTADLTVATKSIDDVVREKKLERVDFIKMDIEGAEFEALEGARGTISRFAPKLAISVYHRPSDLTTIPKLIREMQPGYRLHLGHYTIHTEETVLFARTES